MMIIFIIDVIFYKSDSTTINKLHAFAAISNK